MKNSWSHEKRGLLAAILVAAGLILLSVLSYLFLDERVLAWLVRHPDYLDKTFSVKTVIQLGRVWIPVWLLLCWALLAGRRQEAMVALIAMLLLLLIVPPLKAMFDRPRPRDVIEHQIKGDVELEIYKCSFPSGDTASIFAIAATIFPYISWFTGCFVFALAGCVGVLRVLSSAHYPSDVFAGAAIGVLVGYFAYYLAASIPFLKNNLVKLLSPRIILLAVIIIPSMVALFGKLNNFLVFLKFYPLVVVFLYLLSKIRSPKKIELEQEKTKQNSQLPE